MPKYSCQKRLFAEWANWLTLENLLEQLVHVRDGIFAGLPDKQRLLVLDVRHCTLREWVQRPLVHIVVSVFGVHELEVDLSVDNFDFRGIDVESKLTESVEYFLHESNTAVELLSSIGSAADGFVILEVGCLAFLAAVERW